MSPASRIRTRLGLLCIVTLLTACTSIDIERDLGAANATTSAFTGGQLTLARSDADRASRRQLADQLLAAPLTRDNAVQLALANSAAVQTLLAQGWAETASAAQGGRLPNPVFAFERLRSGDELELGRLLSFGLLDLLTLPQRQRIADGRIEQARARLAGEVVDAVTAVRFAWVRAVAAQQALQYAHQVLESAAVSAELARRMEAVGNFNKITRARQQAFYADAATRLAVAQQQALASREALVRALGLDDDQARRLRLPERLPDLPQQPLLPAAVTEAASRTRLDVRLAQAGLNAAARAQGLEDIVSLTDLEVGLRRDTHFDNAAGTRSTTRGAEIDVRLPLFDWGELRRDAANAQTLAAINRLEAVTRGAGSQLREAYASYRTAWDIARHHRSEVIPLRKLIADENLLRYNAMLIGVFELLADARDQVSTVLAAIDAEQQFWLADAALQASVAGRPLGLAIAGPANASGSAAASAAAH